MTPLRPLIPLLTAAAILLAGNGAQGTMVALRGAAEGFAPVVIGVMGTAYFAGFISGCIWTPRLVQAVGHIRVFAALAATASAGTLALVLMIEPVVWMSIRFGMGFCFSGLFMVIESWLNASAEQAERARILSIYRLVDLAAVAGSQYLLPIFDPGGFELFAVVAMLFCLCLVPVSLADRSRPQAPVGFRFNLIAVWHISPLASLGCVTIGMTNSAFRLIGPLYAEDMGLNVAEVATFMGAGIVGGAALQYPLAISSDRLDRRWTLLAATVGAMLAGTFLAATPPHELPRLYVGIFLFGACALPLYSLSAAHANNKASADQFVLVAAGLSFFFSFGAMAGPPIASIIIARYGAPALFVYTSAAHGLFILMALWRIHADREIPGATQRRIVAMLRASPIVCWPSSRARNRSRESREASTAGPARDDSAASALERR